ncbi:hypothetical protein [Sinomonas gamaensis]|jgi:hypothetical protein|uniref:hypothetical protein n=1 Tax=Sinomonas gamaensis TaxID=2565624 RepID=UPI001109A553|nr:hypothetical protein [Sinomonas gamaensis]
MSRIAFLVVAGFVALTSFLGGLVMALGSWLGPERLGLPPEVMIPNSMLAGSPFASFLVPGILLAVIVGGTHVAAVVLVIGNHRWGQLMAAAAGYSILIWIFVQMVFIPFSVLQLVYFLAGLAEIGFLLLMLGLLTPQGATHVHTASEPRRSVQGA